MMLLDHLREHSERVRLDIYRGNEWVDRLAEFQQLIEGGQVLLVRMGGKTVVVLPRISDPIEQEIEQQLARYDIRLREDIRQAFSCFATSRQTRKVSPAVLRRVLVDWKRFSVDAVREGVGIYVGLEEHSEYNEYYCTGIIRRIHKRTTTVPPPPPSTVEQQRTEEAVEEQLKLRARIRHEFVSRGGVELPLDEAQQLLSSIRDEFT